MGEAHPTVLCVFGNVDRLKVFSNFINCEWKFRAKVYLSYSPQFWIVFKRPTEFYFVSQIAFTLGSIIKMIEIAVCWNMFWEIQFVMLDSTTSLTINIISTTYTVIVSYCEDSLRFTNTKWNRRCNFGYCLFCPAKHFHLYVKLW